MLGGVGDAHRAAHHDEPLELLGRRQRLAAVWVAEPQLEASPGGRLGDQAGSLVGHVLDGDPIAFPGCGRQGDSLSASPWAAREARESRPPAPRRT